MEDLKAKYKLGQEAYVIQTSSENNFIYIKRLKIISVEFGLNGLITYKLEEGFVRREPDLITDLEMAKDHCRDAISEKANANLKMLEKGENLR